MKQLLTNHQGKAVLAVAAVAVLAVGFLVERKLVSAPKLVQDNGPLVKSAPVSITADGKKVEADEPVAARAGRAKTLNLTSQSSGTITVTVPGLQDRPVAVAPGKAATLELNSATAGTYPIIEHGTAPNTRSVEGGTTQYDMEAGTVQFK